jgi:peptidoglycan/xylan/chitin deacetylase (PgdA/CDA1 family)
MKTAHVIVATFMILLFAGCTHQSEQKTESSPSPTVNPVVTPEIDLEQVKPNELGQVMILEYHDIGKKEGRWVRTPDNFRRDLQRLYELDYRPISLRDYVTNNITTEAGKTPVIITFDDSTEGQFRILSDGSIDPDCAFAILKEFNRTHPDFRLEATFYVIYPTPFGQREHVRRKFKEIVDAGMDIGNHTYNHASLKNLSADGVMKELALAVREAKQLEPRAVVDSIALPYGQSPKDENVLRMGRFEDNSYTNLSALLVGANPAPSPVSAEFNPFRLPRIQAVDPSLATFGIDQWLAYFEKNPEKRYVSDGDPDIISVPEAMLDSIDKRKLIEGKRIRAY